jgi:hypothetical protein
MGTNLKYPRVASIYPYKCHPKARPKCSLCDEIATHKSTIEVNEIRAENIAEPRCLKHKWENAIKS